MISASGLKVLPREVEEVLFLHPKVQEAVVAGVPDPYRGETVKAFVVPKAGAKPTVEELIAFCKLHLASFKVPTQIEFRDDLPKSLVGKVLRRVLVDEEKAKRRRTAAHDAGLRRRDAARARSARSSSRSVASIVIAVDLVTKAVFERAFFGQPTLHLLGDTVRVDYVLNTGVFLSLGPHARASRPGSGCSSSGSAACSRCCSPSP